MGEFGIIIRNVKEFDKGVEEMIARVNRASEVIVRQGGQVVARESKKIFLGSPTKKGPNGRGKGQQGQKSPSWPRPTNRTGHLRDSIRVEVKQEGSGRWSSTTGPTTIYGRRVELGGGANRPFPYMEPGFDKALPELKAIYRSEWAKALA